MTSYDRDRQQGSYNRARYERSRYVDDHPSRRPDGHHSYAYQRRPSPHDDRGTSDAYFGREDAYYDDHHSRDDMRARDRHQGYSDGASDPKRYVHGHPTDMRIRDRYHRERSPPRQPPPGRYHDRDHEAYRSPDREGRGRGWSRSRSRSRGRSRTRSHSRRRSRSPHYGASPSRDVIMEGLPPDISSEHISKELLENHGVTGIEDIRVIRDKITKQCRGFGFLRFASVAQAKSFLEQHHPLFRLSYQSSVNADLQMIEVQVAFSRERDDREPDWRCPHCRFVNFATRQFCFKCHAPQAVTTRAVQPQQPAVTNTGDSDVSLDGAPSQFLLLRPLEASVTEELLAKGVAKLYKPSGQSADGPPKKSKIASTTGDANLGARDNSIRRVMLVRDRKTNDSWRYGFAEFAAVEDAQAALTRFNSFEKFTIASKPVHVTYIHAGVFVPVYDAEASPDEVTFASSLNSAVRLQYWDEGAYVSELVLNDATDAMGADTEAGSRSTADVAAAMAEREGLVGEDDAEGKGKKRKAETKGSEKPKKTAPAHLQFWSDRHAELHGLPPKQDADATTEGGDSAEGPPEAERTAISYAHLGKLCCYLCSRQFKTEAEVHKHERLSDLHQTNLANEALKTKALAKLAKAGIDPVAAAAAAAAAGASTGAGAEYRDRARERRHAFGPSKPIHLPLKKDAKKPGTAQRPEMAAADPDAAGVGASSKGAALLGKMGWSAGQGLGAQGEGRTAPLATDAYAAGVGLGAAGGRLGDAAAEASRNTRDSYADFVERARDKAKERFERME